MKLVPDGCKYPDCFHCPFPDCRASGCFPGESRRNADLAGLKDLGKRVKGEETGERVEEET